ncbi:MAG TPA: hypothetical protein VKF84_07490 [Candidatus Sulfotelmatobacter sp.]|nr:hypothetical protein [Candidatus Sulfotelmatobacter sp.]
MRTKILTGIAIAIAGLLSYQILFSRTDPQGWFKFSSPEGRFEILMPAEPVTGRVIDLPLPKFTARLHPYWALRPPSFGVMCGYADFPSPPENSSVVFDWTRDGSITSVRGKLIAEENRPLGGYPGRRFRSTAQGESFIDEEMHLVGQRLYLITVYSKTESPDKNINKVFDSFRFTPASQ